MESDLFNSALEGIVFISPCPVIRETIGSFEIRSCDADDSSESEGVSVKMFDVSWSRFIIDEANGS